ncbi:hypothetical protein K445DRAFT_319620 [Daldinia sp. EC12]|nr:hypothetical protein K445DRAFT_319620 [Daldinia sp. EC12]
MALPVKLYMPVLPPDTVRGESFMPLLQAYIYSPQKGVYVYVFPGLFCSVTITYLLEITSRFCHSGLSRRVQQM